MPVQLPELSRRDFLKRTGLAGLALALAPGLHAELLEKNRDPHTVALFSDPHISADPDLIFNDVNMTDRLTTAVRELGAWPVRPAAVIVNGDLAYRNGPAADYAQFGKLIEPVRSLAPVYLSLGNHDDRNNFWTAFPADAAAQSQELRRQATVFATDRANWFLLDSLNLTGHTQGDLGTVQLDWLARELNQRTDKPAIIVCHHNLELRFGEMGGLKDSPEFVRLLAEHRQVKAFVFGHTHNWHVETHATGVHLINLPPTSYVFRLGRPSGWVRATLAENGMEVELRAINRRHPEHGLIKQLTWRMA